MFETNVRESNTNVLKSRTLIGITTIANSEKRLYSNVKQKNFT